MEIINKQHATYKAERRIKNGRPFIYFSNDMKRFFISARAAYDFDLVPGSFCHFVIDMDRIFIFFNENPNCLKSVEHYGGLKFQSELIIDILTKKNEMIGPGARFLVKRHVNKIQDSMTLEILLNKRVELHEKASDHFIPLTK